MALDAEEAAGAADPGTASSGAACCRCVLRIVMLTTVVAAVPEVGAGARRRRPTPCRSGCRTFPIVREHFALTAFVVVGAMIHVIGWAARAPPFAAPAHRVLRHPRHRRAGGRGRAPLRRPDAACRRSRRSATTCYVVLAMPVFLMVMVLGSQLFLAWTSSRSQDPEREWGARFNAWVLIVAVSWLVFSALVLLRTVRCCSPSSDHGARGEVPAHADGWLVRAHHHRARMAARRPERRARAVTSRRSSTRCVASRSRWRHPLFAATIVVLISALDGELIRRTCLFRPA